MRNFRFIPVALLLAAALSASCGRKAVIRGTLLDAPDRSIAVSVLDVNVIKVLDTVKTDSEGRYRCKVSVAKGEPEFIYLYYGDTKIASLLLEHADKVEIEGDTLGNFKVSGSPESEKLAMVEKRLADFNADMIRLSEMKGTGSEMGARFVEHYRQDVHFLLENPYSLVTIPVLYETLNGYTPVFGRAEDALHFRAACDSLKTVYPDSKYVRALEKETLRREKILELRTKVDSAPVSPFPELNLPDINGNKRSLSEVGARVILLHFWSSASDADKFLNLEVLKPLYDKYHSSGLEIYAVGVDPDKARWASVVGAQQLGWINVNDGLGTASTVLGIYNVTQLPQSLLIGNGEVVGAVDGKDLDRRLARLLK